MRSVTKKIWLPTVLTLLAIAVVGVGCRQHAADAWLAADEPSPDAQGNYRAAQRRPLHPHWQVVDPDNLQCRMPKAFQWRDLAEPVNNAPEWNTIGGALWNEQRQNPLDWPVMKVLPAGTVVSAWGGNLGAMIVLDDHRNQPWLPVWVQEGNREGHCFVRANETFIRPVVRPVESSRSAP
jgi:hypothetical protein